MDKTELGSKAGVQIETIEKYYRDEKISDLAKMFIERELRRAGELK